MSQLEVSKIINQVATDHKISRFTAEILVSRVIEKFPNVQDERKILLECSKLITGSYR